MAKLFKKSWRSFEKLCICGRNDIIKEQLFSEPFSGANSAIEVQGLSSNSDISFYGRIKSTSNRCNICNMECTTLFYCQPCNSLQFQSRFNNWTTGNRKLDEFIQNSQLAAKKHSEIIEFIPYKSFHDIQYEASGGFGDVYSATWKSGPIESYMEWDNQRQDWKRRKSELVALKKIKIPHTISDEFIKALTMQLRLNDTRQINRLFGISLDPENNEYVLVTAFRPGGSLRQYILGNQGEPLWDDLLVLLADAAESLHKIHNMGCIHQNFHTGNILINLDPLSSYISDLGISFPADVNPRDNLYGVLPFLAPELLHGGIYTPASDIYSFGMVMFEIAAGELPFKAREYNIFLTIDICGGLRPEIPNNVPKCFADLIERCWHAEPDQRPSAVEIAVLLTRWHLRKPPDFANNREVLFDMSNGEKRMLHENLDENSRVISKHLGTAMFRQTLRDRAASIQARESMYSEASVLATEKVYLFSLDEISWARDFIL